MSTFFSKKSILVPFDFSDQAKEAVDEALQMGDDTTTVRVLNVVVPFRALAMEPGMAVDLGDDAGRVRAAQEGLEKLLAGKAVQIEARLGDPGHEIVDYAKEVGVDLIVMPSHGRTGISRLFLGSVAERVMRLAECPVMVLREPKK